MFTISQDLMLKILLVLLLFFLLIYFLGWEIKKSKKKESEGILKCPIRGILRARKYDTKGNYTEEYQRIRLITYFLSRGYSPSAFRVEHPLEKSFGHQGHSKVKILVDLVLEKEGQIWIVAEVKKGYRPEKKKSAIEHQLKLAMAWTWSKYGIYFDGTKNSRLLSRNGIITIVALISPFRSIRESARDLIDDFVEVWVKCSVEICRKRDPKGLYKKADEGQLLNLTGIQDPYEPPTELEVIIDTEKESERECVEKIMKCLKELEYIRWYIAITKW